MIRDQSLTQNQQPMRKTRILRSKRRQHAQQTNPLKTAAIIFLSLIGVFACATTTVFAGALGSAAAVYAYFARD